LEGRIRAIAIFAVWGTYHLLHGDYLMAAFQYSVASFHWWGKYLFEYIAERTAKREEKQEKNDDTLELPKNPSLFLAYLKSNHNKVCPPIAFVDENDSEVRV